MMDKTIDKLRLKKNPQIEKDLTMYYESYELNSDSLEFLKEIQLILETCIIYDFLSVDGRKLCELIQKDRNAIKGKPKDMSKIERQFIRISGLSRQLLEIIPYKFFFMGGAMAETRTLYAKSHSEAWKKANDHCVKVLGGTVRCILCLSVNDKDVGTLKNLESMFAPIEDTKKVRSVRATDLIPNYKSYK